MYNNAIKINDFEPDSYNAGITEYEIEPYDTSSRNFCPPSSVMPVMLSSTKSCRKILLTIEFFGENEIDVAENQSKFTHYLEQNEIELQLLDGFIYHCVLSSIGGTKRVAPFIYTTQYEFVGYKHKEKIISLVSSDDGASEIIVDATEYSNALFIITGTGTNKIYHNYTDVNGKTVSNLYEVVCDSTKLHIDGINKTATEGKVNTFGKRAKFTKFPELAPGKNQFKFVVEKGGRVFLRIEYYPIFT